MSFHLGTITPGRTARFASLCAFATLVTCAIHEAAHYLMGETLGYNMWVGFGNIGLDPRQYDTDFHAFLIVLAGPVVTLLQAFLFSLFIWSREQVSLYPFVFAALFMQFAEIAAAVIAMPSDQALVSLQLGLPAWLMPLVFASLISLICLSAARRAQTHWRHNVIAGLASGAMFILIWSAIQLLSQNIS